MNQAAYAINMFDNSKGCALSSTSFSDLTQHAVWGARLSMKNKVVATHQELAMLRQCAENTLDRTNHVVHVISSNNQQQTYYLVKTLMHLGISCGQIIVRNADNENNCPDGVWLFVEDTSLVN